MNIKFDGSYKRMNVRTGKMEDRFRYIVQGTKEELAQYEEIKGEYHRANDEGEPLFFSQNFVGQLCPLKFTLDGTNVYPDTSELDIAKNLITQNEGALAQALASVVAQQMLANAYVRAGAQPTAVPADKKDGAIDNV